ncbi:lipoprotein YcdR [Escherichia coli]|uniref:Lipoprotein YcdR n=1 Tax=Escherichia coli TaxID=562 RepID=A0A376YET6_ECOLX|nr:lipoprotein YcdR [Escherichia coli]
MSVRTSALREQFAWLRENGYQPVSIAQIREAHRGGKPLPEKAVVLTFDDGYQSFYTRVFPILQASSGLLYGPPSAVGSIRQRINK